MGVNKYTLQEDLYDRLPDGRRRLIARAGQVISMQRARAMGLVQDPAPGAPAVRPSETKGEPETGELNATSGALALAQENGVDLAAVNGTGKGGRIVKADVEAVIGD